MDGEGAPEIPPPAEMLLTINTAGEAGSVSTGVALGRSAKRQWAVPHP